MIRILNVVGAPNRGGAETMAMNIYRNVDRSQFQFDFTNHTGVRGPYEDEIESLGGKVWYLPKFKGYNYFQYTNAWKELLKAHPEYQIVHIHNYNLAGIVSRVARQMGVKVIIAHSHSTRLNMPWIKRIVFHCFHHSMMHNATHRFACGTKAGKFLYGNSDFKVIANAINTDKFKFDEDKRAQLRQSLGITPHTTVIGHVGSFRTPKNHSFLIDICAELHRQNPDTVFLLIGQGELFDEVKKKISSLELDNCIKLLGPKDNVNEWLSAFDIFIMPSLWEGLPVSVVEAQCAGLPCVISDVIDRDVDLTGEVVYLPLSLSASEWAQNILSIHKTDRKEMGSIVENSIYNIDLSVKGLSDFYNNSVNQ